MVTGRPGARVLADKALATLIAHVGLSRGTLDRACPPSVRKRALRMPIAAPFRLLLIDADDQRRTPLRRRLTRLGYEAMEAADTDKALSMIGVLPFDLALLDLDLPGPGGLETLSRLREVRPELPILVVTPAAAPEDRAAALAHGASDALPRPLEIGVLQGRLDMHLRGGRERRDPRAAGRALELAMARMQEALPGAQGAGARLVDLGPELWAPYAGALNAAAVLAQVCDAPDLARTVESLETVRNALLDLLVQALPHPDRRSRAPKPSLRVLSADDESGTRYAMRGLLDAAAVGVELVEVATGLEAAQAAKDAGGRMFDLMVVNVATTESIAGIRSIRRMERQTRARRTPILAIAALGEAAFKALEAGADIHLPAPVTPESLLAAVAAALRREAEDLRAVA
jgi:DNA-binding response OmpR family regulator